VRLRSDTYFKEIQSVHINDNFKYDYKFSEGSERCFDVTEGSAKYSSRKKCVIDLHAAGTTVYISEDTFLRE
jgi:hypothetical protein